MILNKQIGRVLAVSNMASGGAVALTASTDIEEYRIITIAQSTAGQTATIPAPADTSNLHTVLVSNTGSETIVMYGVNLTAAGTAAFTWNGSAWTRDVAPTAGGEVMETLTPTALNDVPDLAVAPLPGTIQKIFVRDSFVASGVSVDVAGAITVTPATLGYNVAVTDTVTVVYTPS